MKTFAIALFAALFVLSVAAKDAADEGKCMEAVTDLKLVDAQMMTAAVVGDVCTTLRMTASDRVRTLIQQRGSEVAAAPPISTAVPAMEQNSTDTGYDIAATIVKANTSAINAASVSNPPPIPPNGGLVTAHVVVPSERDINTP